MPQDQSSEARLGAEAAGSATRDQAVGYAAGAVAVTIWAAWIVWTRGAVTGVATGPVAAVNLSAIDIGLLRFGVPALLLAPLWLRFGLRDSVKPPQTTWPVLIAMLGWGAPFVLLISAGMAHSPSSHVGALVPGTMPLWAALFGWLLFREAFSPARRLGLALVLTGAALIVGPGMLAASATGAWGALAGTPWLLGAAASWACFALAFKRSGLDPARAAGVVAAYSTLAFVALAAIYGTRLGALPWDALIYQIVTQGVLSGVVSIVTYTIAIDRLGAPRAASLSAMVPVLAAMLAIPMLGEPLAGLDVAAIAAASLGVAAINGAFGSLRFGGG